MKNLTIDIYKETLIETVDLYNVIHKRRIISKQLKKESKIVRKESMNILKEFDATPSLECNSN